MKPAPFDYQRPADLAGAIALLAGADGDARPLAGGQSLGPMLNLRLLAPVLLVDISRLEELTHIESDDAGVVVGGAVRHAAFEDGEVPDVAGGMLQHVARGLAYRAVRNRGTIGGSLAHADPAADWPPVMLALGAEIRTASVGGGRSLAPAALADGILTTVLSHDELISSIHIPRLAPGARWGHYKICRKPGEFADSIAAVMIDRENARCRVALGSPDHPPQYLERTAALLCDVATWSDSLAPAIKAAVIDDLTGAGRSPETEPYGFRIHPVSVARATREAFSR